MSGLAAAVRLAHAGERQLTIFEARREAGGRTRSYLDPVTGDILDNGQHLIMGCYRDTLRYLQLIGSDDRIQRLPLSIRFHERGKSAVLEIPPKSKPPQNLLAAIWSSPILTIREKLSAIWFGMAIDASSLKSCEGLTCAELFLKFRQPKETVRKLWAPIVLATINAPLEQASAVLFVSVIREAFLSGPNASDLLIPNAGLSELLIDPALRMLHASGATVRLSTAVRAIELRQGGLSVGTDYGEELFDSVIYAGQSSKPLPPEVQATIPNLEYSPIVNAYFWLDRKVLDGPVHAFLGTSLQWAFPKASTYSEQRLALTVSAANELAEHTNEEIRHILWTDLCTAVPAAREARLMHHQIIREKRATPLITPSLQADRPKAATPVPHLFLSGDLVQNGLPATIEGAIHNGFTAADLLPL